MTTWASRRLPNFSIFNSSSRQRPLKLSTKGVLPWRARLDVAGRGVVQPAPVAQRPGDELGTVVHPQMLWRSSLGDEPFDDGHDVIGGAVASDVHGQGLARVFVDDVAQLQPPAIGGLVELEVDGPRVVRSLGPQQRRAARRPRPLALAGRRPP